MNRVLAQVLFVLLLVPGCGSGPSDPGPDGGGGADGGVEDASSDDNGVDAETPADNGVDADTPDDVGTGLAPLGASCAGASECDSGFCADGVCCNAACDGVCEQCSAAGACEPLGTTVECRPSAGACDVAESCNGTEGTCPADAFASGGNTCAPFACSGTAPTCPTSCANQSECATGVCVGGSCIDARIVFTSSVATNGNLAGVAGADLFCQALASQAGLAGTFRAWVSTTTSSAASRMTPAAVPYVTLVAGQPAVVVADSWTDFTDETLDAPIIRTETGEVCTSDHVWTNTFAAGSAPHDVVSCQGWTSASSSDIGIVGSTTAVTSDWSFTLNRACDSLQGLYCVQQ